MKYSYTILLELEAKEKNAGKRLQTYMELLTDKAVEHYNKKSARSKKPKRIVGVDVNDYTLTIELDSEEKLNAPFKAMRSYSQYLLNNGMGELADDNALFRSVSIEEDVNEMTDERMLNILLHMVLRKTKRDEELIEEIKHMIEERIGDQA